MNNNEEIGIFNYGYPSEIYKIDYEMKQIKYGKVIKTIKGSSTIIPEGNNDNLIQDKTYYYDCEQEIRRLL